MRPVVGHLVDDVDGFLAEAFEAERPALAGRARWVEVLPVLLERWGLADSYDDALRVWLTIEPVVETQDVVRSLRGHGIRCCLATNQDEHRGRYMQETFGVRRPASTRPSTPTSSASRSRTPATSPPSWTGSARPRTGCCSSTTTGPTSRRPGPWAARRAVARRRRSAGAA